MKTITYVGLAAHSDRLGRYWPEGRRGGEVRNIGVLTNRHDQPPQRRMRLEPVL
jgi:hypothetical protein